MTKILSIDDSRAVHAFIRQCLAGLKVEITDAFNGKEGVVLATSKEKKFDLILLDWEMPELDGLGTLKAFKSASVQTPVIMLTSKNKTEEIAEILENGASEYIMKPFTADILIDKIETTLSLGIR